MDKSRHNFGIFTEYEHESKQVVVLKSIISSFLPVINFEEGISFLVLAFVIRSFNIVNLFQNLALNIELILADSPENYE